MSGSPDITSQRSPYRTQPMDSGTQLNDPADSGGICPFTGQTLPAPAPWCCKRGAGLVSGACGTAPEHLSPSPAGPKGVCTACACSPIYEPLFFSFLMPEGFSPCSAAPFTLVVALLPSLVEEAQTASFQGHSSEGSDSWVPSGPPGSPALLLSSDTQQG